MCKTIQHKVKLRASPEAVYRTLADAKHHAALTGKTAQISRKVGGAFAILGGRVTGLNVDLVPGERLVQAWRTNEFPEGIFSMAAIRLTRTKDGGTALALTHRGVPKQLIPKVEQQWRRVYWEPMRAHSPAPRTKARKRNVPVLRSK